MKIPLILAEDEELTRRGVEEKIRLLFPEEPFRIYPASGGEEARELWERFGPAILLTDIRMPGMSGLELLEKLGGREGWPAAVLTAYEEFDFARRALRLGVEEYLLKPVGMGPLRDFLEKALHRGEALERGARLGRWRREGAIWEAALGGRGPFPPEPASPLPRTLLGVRELSEEAAEEFWERLAPPDTARPRLFSRGDTRWMLLDVYLEEDSLKRAGRFLRDRRGRGVYALFCSPDDPAGRVVDWVSDEFRRLPGEFRGLAAASREGEKPGGAFFSERRERFLQAVHRGDFHFLTEECGAFFSRGGLSLAEAQNFAFSLVMLCCGKEEGRREEDPFLRRIPRYAGLDRLAEDLGEFLIRWRDRLPRQGSQGEEALQEVIRRMRSRPEEALSLEGIAEEMGISKSYFSRLFKSRTGCTLSRFQNRERIARAKTLLRNTELNQGEIARIVGYRDQYYYLRQFRQITGMTPKEYRLGEKEP